MLPSNTHWTFHAEGMSCIKCIRKIQSSTLEFEGLKKLKIDLGLKRIQTETNANFKPEDFMAELKKLGFNLKVVSNTEKHQARNLSQKPLLRIGVAGFAAGNIMLFSVAEYVGAGIESWSKVFLILSGALFLPVIFYAAVPFYQNAYAAILARRMSIDAPIVLAIWGGALISFYNILLGSNEVYFDSISMFVFLLLASRYLVFKIQNKYLTPIKVEDVFSNPWTQKITPSGLERVQVETLNVGDVIEVFKNEFVPLDGELISKEVIVSDAFFSGEFLPKVKTAQDVIYAGSKNLSASLVLKVKKITSQTRLAEIVEKLNMSLAARTEITTLADRGAHYFGIVTICLACLVLAFFALGDLHEGLNRVLALLVVACPCGLAIVIPLIQTLAIKQGLNKSVLIKQPQILENLNQIKTIFFDKTGTLTSGEIQVLQTIPRSVTAMDKKIIYNLERQSEHPIAKALMKWVGSQDHLIIEDIFEKLGVGVSGYYKNDFYELKSSQDQLRSSVHFMKNHELVFSILLQDTLAHGAKELMAFVKSKGIEVFMISGDLKSHALKVAADLEIDAKNVLAELSPEAKQDFVKEYPGPSLYIGDGVNDSMAMSKALVSISMDSAAIVAYKSSNAHILSEGLTAVKALFELSELYLRVIKITVFLSFFYNLIFAAFALMGFIGPLIAVFLMPLSSISLTLLALNLMRVKTDNITHFKFFEGSQNPIGIGV